MQRNITLLLPLLLTLLYGTPLLAEVATRSGEYTVHHNAFKADFIPPEVARRHDLDRSKYRGMVNIAVIREQPGTTGQAVAATIDIAASDLMQRSKSITLQEIREGDAIYYIGSFPIIDQEIIHFRLRVRPEGSSQLINARFSQQFYVD